MAKSIIQKNKECLICETTLGLHEHHIVFGNANRQLSEKYGLKVYLCHKHHTGPQGIHFNESADDDLKKLAQMKFEEVYGANKCFREIFGINYL